MDRLSKQVRSGVFQQEAMGANLQSSVHVLVEVPSLERASRRAAGRAVGVPEPPLQLSPWVIDIQAGSYAAEEGSPLDVSGAVIAGGVADTARGPASAWLR